MSDRLLSLATANHGVLSTADGERLEVDANAMAALVSSGALVRVRRSAYVLGERWAAATPEQRLGLTARAVLRARQGTDEAASHQSALAVHGLPVHGMPVDVIDLMGAVRRVRRASGVRVHPVDPTLEVVHVDGCPAVSVDVALAQVLLRHGRDPAVIAADAALASARADLDSVLSVTRRLAESPRSQVRAVRWWGQVDPASESVGESRARLLLTDLGFEVRSQVQVADRDGITFARVDFLVGEHVVVEFDGMLKYADADGRQALAAEKHREDRLRSLGYEVVRLTWADLGRPQRVQALVRSALERAARAHAQPAS
jgi:hypothetical protein